MNENTTIEIEADYIYAAHEKAKKELYEYKIDKAKQMLDVIIRREEEIKSIKKAIEELDSLIIIPYQEGSATYTNSGTSINRCN